MRGGKECIMTYIYSTFIHNKIVVEKHKNNTTKQAKIPYPLHISNGSSQASADSSRANLTNVTNNYVWTLQLHNALSSDTLEPHKWKLQHEMMCPRAIALLLSFLA